MQKQNQISIYIVSTGFIWWTLTAFSRLSVGAHYLSDVAIAGLITIFVYNFVLSVINKNEYKTKQQDI